MKERPILFSAPMVRAILEGRKTMTRRIVKPQPPFGCRYEINGAFSHALCIVNDPSQHSGAQYCPPTPKSTDHRLECPYGEKGDLLWVKETWRSALTAFEFLIQYRATGDLLPVEDLLEQASHDLTDEERDKLLPDPDRDEWRPSIFMRRWMSRITLEITGVRVERLQDISEGDAKAEGAPCELGKLEGLILGAKAKYRSGFVRIWESCYGLESWDANPYVWVVEFKRLESEVRA